MPGYYPVLRPIEEERRWYGWQTLIIHGIAATIVLVTMPASEGEAAPVVVPVAIGAATFGGPIVHWAHGKVAAGFASLGLNIAGTFGGATFGALVGGIVDTVEDGSSGYGWIVGAFFGMPFGAVAGFALDLSLLSFEEPEKQPEPPKPPSVSLVPTLRIDGERAVIGVAGLF
jgi:hypothetical protein